VDATLLACQGCMALGVGVSQVRRLSWSASPAKGPCDTFTGAAEERVDIEA